MPAHQNQRSAPFNLLIVSALFAVLSACSAEDRTAGFVATDSAGIALMTSTTPAWQPDQAWTIDTVPAFSFGAAEGDSTQLLYRVTSALLLHPDTIVLSNSGTFEVRWYDPTGRMIRTSGRSGAGPGEYGRSGPGVLCRLPAQRLLVNDGMQQRANIIAHDGSFVQTIRFDGDAAFPSVQGCFADGSLLGWRGISPADRIPGTIIHTRFAWSRLGADGKRANELIELPGVAQYLLDVGGGTATYHAIPFNGTPSAAAGSDKVYLTTGRQPAIERHRAEGGLEGVIRWVPAQRIRSADVYDRFRGQRLESVRGSDRYDGWVKFFDLGIDYPDEVPTVQRLMVDDDEHVWAERYRLPWDTVPMWEVFRPDGRWLGSVPLPRRFRPTHITRAGVLGIASDDDGVERVRFYAIRGRD